MSKRKKDEKKPYPALRKKSNTRIRQQFTDFDYTDKLSLEEYKWLSQFTNEYYNANLELDEEKNIIPDQNLHQTPEHKKEIYDNNNKRNSDLLGIIQSKSGKVKNNPGKVKLLNWDSFKWQIDEELSSKNPDAIENALIDYIDSKKKLDK